MTSSTNGTAVNRTTRLLLVRHGQSVANVEKRLQGQSHGELTPLGRQQVTALAEYSSRLQVDHLISSDLRRAYETAQAIARVKGLDLHVTSEVREWNIGVLDGEPHEAWQAAIDASDAPEHLISPDGGESLNDVRDRAQAFLEETLKQTRGQSTMVVCHGDFIRACLRVLLNLSFEQASAYRPKNASYTILELNDNSEWQLVSFGSVNHLEKLNTLQQR